MPVDRDKPKSQAPAWAGYTFALVATASMMLLRTQLNQWISVSISLPLCGIAAVFFCIWQAGLGPAIVATLLTTAWYIRDTGATDRQALLHYALYLAEATAFCFYGHQLRVARDQAAKGEDWRRHLVQTAGEGIWMIGPDGVINYANPRIAEILGCSEDEITGSNVEAFLFPEDLPAERIRFQNRRAGFHAGLKEQYDRRLRRADGSEVWTLACSSPYSYRDKEVGVLTMMTDITERKQAEYALRRSERKFRELFENIREGVYQTSLDGRILAANPELLRMLGFSSQEELNVIGVVKDTFVDIEIHQSLRDRLERDGSYANVEFQLRARDHRIITVSENARVVRDENGNVLYYEGTLTDITEKLRFEKQFRHAQKMEALGRLAGGIARDFRAIGDGMATSLQRALDALPPESPARPRLDALASSMNSAAALTRQILDFSQRQTAAADGSDREPMDINTLVLSLEPSLRHLADTSGLEMSLCEQRVTVLADPGNMKQILSSLVIHVRDLAEGAGKIEISTGIQMRGHIDAGRFVYLSVYADHIKNTAAGLPAWIGMATSRAILAQYGGMLSVESSPGLRYSLYLPLASGTLIEKTGNAALTNLVTVLLVEEEPLIRELSRDMLEQQGLLVLTAGSSAEAERIARGPQTFDLLIADWPVDGADGTAVVQRLRNNRPNLRILFTAGYSDASVDATPLPEGAAILQKPFSGDSLGRKIRELLNRPDPT